MRGQLVVISFPLFESGFLIRLTENSVGIKKETRDSFHLLVIRPECGPALRLIVLFLLNRLFWCSSIFYSVVFCSSLFPLILFPSLIFIASMSSLPHNL